MQQAKARTKTEETMEHDLFWMNIVAAFHFREVFSLKFWKKSILGIISL